MRLNYAAPHREVVIAGRERLSAGAILAAEGYGPEAVENGEDRKEGRNGARAPEASVPGLEGLCGPWGARLSV
jgi:hypothetical protein